MKYKLFFILVLFSYSLSAQELNQQDLFDIPLKELKNIPVYSIDYSNRTLTDSFASTHVITSRMIESLPMVVLADYMELLIPGTIVVPQAANGAGLGTRGAGRGGGIRTLTLWDGHSLNRKDTDGNMSVLYSPFLNDLHQIEVVLGPGSVKHGTGALNGYINFVPKSGQNFQGSKVDLDYGPYDESQRVQIQHGMKYGNNRDLYMYAGFFHADGFEMSNDLGGSTSTAQNERRKFQNRDETILGNYEPSYKLSLNWTHDRFNLKTLFEHLEFNPGGLVTNKTALNQRTSLSVQPKYTFQLPSNTTFELSSAVTFFDKSRIQKPINTAAEFDESGGRESAVELRGTLQTVHFNKHELTLGAQLKWLDTTSDKHFFSADPISHNIATNGKWQEHSVFLEDNFYITEKTTLIAGLRYDGAKFNDNFRFEGNNTDVLIFKPDDISNISPRLAATHKTDNEFLFRAVYQEGFAYPNVTSYSRTFEVNNFLRSQGLEPFNLREEEKLQNFEVGLRGELIKDRLQFDLSVYYNRFKNKARFVNLRTNDTFLPQSIDRSIIPDKITGVVVSLDNDVDGYGSELVLNWKPSNSFFANFSYSYAVPDHINPEENEFADLANDSLSQWSRFPKHQVKADLNLKHKKWQFSLAGTYQSGIDINNRFAPDRENAEDDFVRVNAGIKYHLTANTSLSLIAKNIFNNNTPRINSDPSRAWLGGLGTDERLVYLGLGHKF